VTPSDPELERIFAAHLEAISERLVDVAKRLDHLDKCIDNVQQSVREKLGAHMRVVEMLLASGQRLMDAQVKAVEAKIDSFDAKNDLPRWVTKLIIVTVIGAVLAGLLAVAIRPGAESHRSFPFPTNQPPAKESSR
jgi:hypothetical protein